MLTGELSVQSRPPDGGVCGKFGLACKLVGQSAAGSAAGQHERMIFWHTDGTAGLFGYGDQVI